ncbi:hypothetical protein JL722_5159 [Aureococcus anophagefferens]|nr:hypothetical protein JL722_5159 [Aureococcus anophagefferens]
MSYIGRGSLAKLLPEFAQKWVHNLQFRPLRPHTMEPTPEANWVPGAPARSSVEHSDEVFDIGYLGRDTRRARRERAVILAKKYLDPSELKAIEEGENPPALAEGEEAPAPMSKGSAGNFGKLNYEIAVSRYSPDGLRSAMSATHEALAESIKKQDADQLVHYAWEGEADAIVADCKAKGLPPIPGKPFAWKLPSPRSPGGAPRGAGFKGASSSLA